MKRPFITTRRAACANPGYICALYSLCICCVQFLVCTCTIIVTFVLSSFRRFHRHISLLSHCHPIICLLSTHFYFVLLSSLTDILIQISPRYYSPLIPPLFSTFVYDCFRSYQMWLRCRQHRRRLLLRRMCRQNGTRTLPCLTSRTYPTMSRPVVYQTISSSTHHSRWLLFLASSNVHASSSK